MSTTKQEYKPANRIGTFQQYFFARLNTKIQSIQHNGIDIIRLDMGSPDMAPADFILDSLVNSIKNPKSHGYMPHGGTTEFRNAICEYYHRRFKVNLDPVSQVMSLIGSKEGLFSFGQSLTNPGDINLVTDPGYPVYQATTIIAGGEVHFLPINKENGYLPDLDSIPEEVLSKTKILWLNYPNNPTGAIADEEFLKKAIKLAKSKHFVIAFDAPYTDVCYDGYIAPSILQIPEAFDVAVEFNSLSKTYNMAGWRIGMAAGNPDLLKYLSVYKSQADSSSFKSIMDAGITALTGDQSWIKERNQIYCERRDIIYEYLTQLGMKLNKPHASLYIWFHIPDSWEDENEFCNSLLEETGVSLTPGSVYGDQGKGFARISIATPTNRIIEAMNRLSDWLVRKKDNASEKS